MGSQQKQLNIKGKYLLGLGLVLLVSMICAAYVFAGTDDFELAKQEIMLRKIGHEVLLHSGDSTSRVLPVRKIGENEYRITFENSFTFQSDTLVKIVSQSLAKNNVSRNYVVNVLKCGGTGVIFGYAISKNKKDNIIACSGRHQPKDCYLIDIKFQPAGITPSQKGYLLGGLPLLAFIGLMLSRSVKTRKNKIEAPAYADGNYTMGNSLFDPKKRLITTADTTTELTAKENKLLLIFAGSPNIIVERARLQKEIWEDEGVIVGRSLDMFISKLRRKLECDPSIQLINIHGKGYKLEITA
jgi:hypothetical protein